MSVMVAIVFAIAGTQVERLGDRFQVALPIFALGCAIAEGQTARYAGRFILLEAGIHIPKRVLGHAAINMRPNGHNQGFPSGHTSAAAFGATALVQGCLRTNPAAQAVAIIAAGFTGASRISAGKHTIWQVLAGAILGFLMNFLQLAAFDRLFRHLVRRAGRIAGFGGASAMALALLTAARADAAGWTVDVYSGYQTAPHSHVSGTDPKGTGPFSFTAGWEGKSFEMPPYYGIRPIRWQNDRFGIFADFNHTKVYADEKTMAFSGFKVLEFTDGLNNLNVGPIWRFPEAFKGTSPYVGVGLGITIPHVEVKTTSAAPKTFDYQYGGPSVSFITGLEKQFGESRTSGFVEYKFTYNKVDVDLEGGGNLSTKIITNALNLGVRVKLGKM